MTEWWKLIDGSLPANLIAIAAIMVTLLVAWNADRRVKIAEADQVRRRLLLAVNRKGPDALMLTVNFSPPSHHTRYRVEVTLLAPKDAGLSEPIPQDRVDHYILALPTYGADPKAPRRRTMSADLRLSPAPGEVLARFAICGPAQLRTAKVEVRVLDAATGKRILRARETLTA